MDFYSQLEEVLKKKALGFSYSEETVEYETSRPKPFVFCERYKRLFLKSGYLFAVPVVKNGELVGVSVPKKIKILLKPKDFSRFGRCFEK